VLVGTTLRESYQTSSNSFNAMGEQHLMPPFDNAESPFANLRAGSPDRLHHDWQAARARGEKGIDEGLLARVRRGATLVTVGDFHPATLSWLGAVAGNAIVTLGVDRFDQSGDISDL
jgi:pyruvate dehydrogenase complex dehydrogenase (E1) component